MNGKLLLGSIFLNFLHFSFSLSSSNNETAISLISHLLDNYDRLTIPVASPSDVLRVELGISLLQIIQVDEKRQTVSLNIWLRTIWNDSKIFKNWNSFPNGHEYNGTVRIPVKKVWTPDIFLYNAGSQESSLSSLGTVSDVNVLFTRDGTALHVPPLVLKATCVMDLTWFPVDTQSCTLTLGSWTYSSLEINLVLMNGSLASDLDNYIPNGEWELLSLDAEEKTRYYDCCSEAYLSIVFKYVIKRKGLYHLFNLIVPCALIGFLAIFGFTLPPDSPEKLSLGVTVLVSLIVFLNMTSSSMPANSNTPLLGTYFCCVMVMIASSVVSTIVININVKGLSRRNPKKMEGKTRKFFLHIAPQLLGMKWKDGKDDNGKMLEVEEVKNFEDEWIFVAFVVDRFCLFLSIAISTVFMLAVIIMGL